MSLIDWFPGHTLSSVPLQQSRLPIAILLQIAMLNLWRCVHERLNIHDVAVDASRVSTPTSGLLPLLILMLKT